MLATGHRERQADLGHGNQKGAGFQPVGVHLGWPALPGADGVITVNFFLWSQTDEADGLDLEHGLAWWYGVQRVWICPAPHLLLAAAGSMRTCGHCSVLRQQSKQAQVVYVPYVASRLHSKARTASACRTVSGSTSAPGQAARDVPTPTKHGADAIRTCPSPHDTLPVLVLVMLAQDQVVLVVHPASSSS